MSTLSETLADATTHGNYACYFTANTEEDTANRGFHFGNHPVRGIELKRRFGRVQVVAQFVHRDQAERAYIELQGLLRPWPGTREE